MKRLLAVLATSSMAMAIVWGSAANPAHAAPLDSADVAAGAKWMFHADFDAARASKVGEHIRSKALKDEHVKKALAKMHDELGFDPQKDLHGVTMYGTDFTPHTGVLIIYAVADKDKVMARLKAKADFISLKTSDGDHELYTWTEHMGHDKNSHKHTVWASFPKHGVGVFADSAVDLKAALDVIGGKGGLSSSSPLSNDAPKGTVFSGSAVGLTAVHMPGHMPLAKQIDSVSFAAGESDGEDFDHIKVTMTGAEVTKQVKSIVEGFQAMAALHLGDHAEALKMVNGLKVDATDKVLTIDWKASSDDVIQFGEKACEFMKAHHQDWHHGHNDGKASKN